MWLQVQEMLHIEKGGEEQIAGELDTYNPLIPQGRELIATLMLEIEDAVRRETICGTGRHRGIRVDGCGRPRVKATPTDYEDRTTPDGKTHRCIGCASCSRRKKSRRSERRGPPGARDRASQLRSHGGAETRDQDRGRPGISRAPSSSPTLVMARLVRATQLKSGPCTKNLARIPVIIQTSPGGPHSRAMTL